jgi:hypothetical protein
MCQDIQYLLIILHHVGYPVNPTILDSKADQRNNKEADPAPSKCFVFLDESLPPYEGSTLSWFDSWCHSGFGNCSKQQDLDASILKKCLAS